VSGPRSLVELEFFAAASCLDRGGKRSPGSHVSITVASWERLQRARIAFGEEGARNRSCWEKSTQSLALASARGPSTLRPTKELPHVKCSLT
jgi:hypothetical protein